MASCLCSNNDFTASFVKVSPYVFVQYTSTGKAFWSVALHDGNCRTYSFSFVSTCLLLKLSQLPSIVEESFFYDWTPLRWSITRRQKRQREEMLVKNFNLQSSLRQSSKWNKRTKEINRRPTSERPEILNHLPPGVLWGSSHSPTPLV